MRGRSSGQRGYCNEKRDPGNAAVAGGDDAWLRSRAGGGLVAGWQQGRGDRGRWAAYFRSGRKVDTAAGEGCAEDCLVWRFSSIGGRARGEDFELERGLEISGARAGDAAGG